MKPLGFLTGEPLYLPNVTALLYWHWSATTLPTPSMFMILFAYTFMFMGRYGEGFVIFLLTVGYSCTYIGSQLSGRGLGGLGGAWCAGGCLASALAGALAFR